MKLFHLYRGNSIATGDVRTICGIPLADLRESGRPAVCGNLDHRDEDGHAFQVPAGVGRCPTCFETLAPGELDKPPA